MAKTKRAVVVTTEFKGVFFGYLEKEDGRTVTLSKARNCIHWTSEVRGFIGLAKSGPISGCRIGPAADTLKLHAVTSIIDATKEACKAWEKEIF